MTFRTLAITAVLVSATSLAHAQPAASLACATNGPSLNFNVSYFDLGASESASAAAGTRVLMPLTLHASLGSFEALFQAATSGSFFQSCTLTTQASNGDTIQFILKSVSISSVSAVASSATSWAPRKAYVNATMGYQSITVTDSASGNSTTDDGGTPGWDIGANQKT